MMNKYEEALKRIKSVQAWDEGLGDYYNVFNRDNKDLKLIQELVDKATPKKPINYKSDAIEPYPHDICPNCTVWLLDVLHPVEDIAKPSYCPFCGQAIDWSKDE